jgi:CubicO group peptidase (beta-lactamase class C family)
MRNQVFFLAVLLCAIGSVSNGQNNNPRNSRAHLISKIDSILQTKVDLDEIPGAVIEIKKKDRVIYKHTYGYAQKYDYNHKVLNPPEKMTIEHMFDIASLTKVIGTTTSIMLLVDRGKISVDDPVSRYVNAFGTPDKKDITIRNLLTHTAGLYEWYPLYYRAVNKEESYRLIGELPRMFPVGAQRRYSDLGFVILGEIIETVSGMPLEKFEKENIFVPLHMINTTYNPLKSGSFKKIAATSHGNPYEKRMVYDSTLGFKIKEIDPRKWNGWRNYTLRGEVNDGNAWYANGGVSGAAGLFSTIDDLQKLVDMLIDKGKVGSKQFISGKTIQTFFTKDKFSNGLGWMMDPDNSFMKNGPEGTFGHTGFTGTSISVIPKYNISVILLINRQNTGLLKNGDYYNVSPVRMQVFNAVLKYLTLAEGR